MERLLILGWILSLSISLSGQRTVLHSKSAPNPVFVDVAASAGLTVPHIATPDKQYIVESMSGGVGLIDCDGDGKLDIITVNGSTIERFRKGGDALITLYHQDAGFHFTDITAAAGLNHKGWGMGVAVADYDNDGLPDIYVTGYGGNALYHNLGGCRFEDVTAKAGVGSGGFSTGAAWGDYDRDGKLDLFVSRYVHVDLDQLPAFGGDAKTCHFKGVAVQCGPWGLPGESDLLFHNRGDGTFEEVSRKAGVDDPNHYYGLGVIWNDFDDDGWPDLFVANDAGPNYLYRNKRDGTFEETGMISGVALSQDGLMQGSMGVDWGDYRHNGRMSLFVTNFTEQADALYDNVGGGQFSDVGSTALVAKPTYQLVGWGTAFFDFDNDGWLDLFEVNGHVYPQLDQIKGAAPYREPMKLFRNMKNGTFEDVSGVLAGMPPASRRGAAFGDLDNDGNVDVVVCNIDGPPSLLLNKTQSRNHRVLFQLAGRGSNRSAVGAKVTVKTGTKVSPILQIAEVRAGGSYLSSNDLRLHFGLGDAAVMEDVEIRWPDGRVQHLSKLSADKIYVVEEGSESVKALPFSQP